jgi:hypothetical protein
MSTAGLPEVKLVRETPQSDHARLKVGWERFSAIAPELRVLSARQQAEVGVDYEPYDPDWDRYFALDRAGSCAVWTARSLTGVLAGYIIWLTTRGLHNVSTTFAVADLLYLAPEWREGLTGYKLLKTGIAAAQATNPDLIRVETNDLYEHGRVGVLLKRLKFRRIGSVWQK